MFWYSVYCFGGMPLVPSVLDTSVVTHTTSTPRYNTNTHASDVVVMSNKSKRKGKTSLWTKIKTKAKLKSKKKQKEQQTQTAQSSATAHTSPATDDTPTASVNTKAKVNTNADAKAVDETVVEIVIPTEIHTQDAQEMTHTVCGHASESPIKHITTEVSQESHPQPQLQRQLPSELHHLEELLQAHKARRLVEERLQATEADLEALRWRVCILLQTQTKTQKQAQTQAHTCVPPSCVDGDTTVSQCGFHRQLSEGSSATDTDTIRLSDDDDTDTVGSKLNSEPEPVSKSESKSELKIDVEINAIGDRNCCDVVRGARSLAGVECANECECWREFHDEYSEDDDDNVGACDAASECDCWREFHDGDGEDDDDNVGTCDAASECDCWREFHDDDHGDDDGKNIVSSDCEYDIKCTCTSHEATITNRESRVDATVDFTDAIATDECECACDIECTCAYVGVGLSSHDDEDEDEDDNDELNLSADCVCDIKCTCGGRASTDDNVVNADDATIAPHTGDDYDCDCDIKCICVSACVVPDMSSGEGWNATRVEDGVDDGGKSTQVWHDDAVWQQDLLRAFFQLCAH